MIDLKNYKKQKQSTGFTPAPNSQSVFDRNPSSPTLETGMSIGAQIPGRKSGATPKDVHQQRRNSEHRARQRMQATWGTGNYSDAPLPQTPTQQAGQGMNTFMQSQLPESAGQGGGMAEYLTSEDPEVTALMENAPAPWQMALGLVTAGTSQMTFKGGKFLAKESAVKEIKKFILEGKTKRIGERILAATKMTAVDVAGDAAMGTAAPGILTKAGITKAATNTYTAKRALTWLRQVAATAKNPAVAFGILASGLGSTAFSQQFAMNMQDDMEGAILFAKGRSEDDPQALQQLQELYESVEWDTLNKIEKYAPLLNYPLAVLRKHKANKRIIEIEEERLLKKAETDAKKADEFTQQGLDRDRIRAEAGDLRREERNLAYDERREEQGRSYDEQREYRDKQRADQQRDQMEEQSTFWEGKETAKRDRERAWMKEQAAFWDNRKADKKTLSKKEKVDYEKYKKSKLRFGIV